MHLPASRAREPDIMIGVAACAEPCRHGVQYLQLEPWLDRSEAFGTWSVRLRDLLHVLPLWAI